MTIEEVLKTRQKMSPSTRTVINIMYTSRLVEIAASSILKPYDLTIQQYNVLRILRGQKGKPANLSTIQERMIDRSSNTSRLIDKLVAKKMVERKRCPANRRKVEIVITAEGLTILEKLDKVTEDNNRKILQDLSTTDLEQLNQLLDKIH